MASNRYVLHVPLIRHFYPMECFSRMLGDQGTDDRVTGSILPERKVGTEPHQRRCAKGAQRLPHTRAVRPIERSASASRAQRAEMSAYLRMNRVAPGSREEGRERKRVTAPSHGAVWSLSSRLGFYLRYIKVTST